MMRKGSGKMSKITFFIFNTTLGGGKANIFFQITTDNQPFLYNRDSMV